MIKEQFNNDPWTLDMPFIKSGNTTICQIYGLNERVTDVKPYGNGNLIKASPRMFKALSKIASMFPLLKIDPALKIEIEALLVEANDNRNPMP